MFEILVREQLLSNGSMPARKLHRASTQKVNAVAQAKAHDALLDYLTEDEQDILRRGRNAGVSRIPRSCTAEEYHKATALETLFGYLYLSNEIQRIYALYDIILQEQEEDTAS